MSIDGCVSCLHFTNSALVLCDIAVDFIYTGYLLIIMF
jgi:hypothetical protein